MITGLIIGLVAGAALGLVVGLLVRVGHVDQVVGQPCPLLCGWFGCAQVHAAIDSHRVATDDLSDEALAQSQRKRRLPAACGAEQQYEQWVSL